MISRQLTNINSLSLDHKPGNWDERNRISKAGGMVYNQDEILTNEQVNFDKENPGIYRTKPGGLAVSRTIGDVEAKIEEYGGKQGVIIAVPDIVAFKITKEIDFIFLASILYLVNLIGDGVYDKLSNKEVAMIVYETVIDCIKSEDNYATLLHKITCNIIKTAIDKDSRDNISCILIIFENLYQKYVNKSIEELKEAIIFLLNLNEDCNDLYKQLDNKIFHNDKKAHPPSSLGRSSIFHGRVSTITTGAFRENLPQKSKDASCFCGLFSSSKKNKEKKYKDKEFEIDG